MPVLGMSIEFLECCRSKCGHIHTSISRQQKQTVGFFTSLAFLSKATPNVLSAPPQAFIDALVIGPQLKQSDLLVTDLSSVICH